MNAPLEFMEKYKIDSDEIWEVRRGGAWAIKHFALERVASEQGITFDRPALLACDEERKSVAICVFGTLKDRSEWSIGEAAPSNNKNAYPWAMAEKRGKDRVILKLLNAHGKVYSESELDEAPPPKRENPHVTRPEDIMEPIEYDQYGQPVDNIPLGDPAIETLTKANARKDWSKAQSEIQKTKTEAELKHWGEVNANRVASYPTDWAEILRGVYATHRQSLRANGAENGV